MVEQTTKEVDYMAETKRKAIIAINMMKHALWRGYTPQVRVHGASGNVTLQMTAVGFSFKWDAVKKSSDEAMEFFRVLGIHNVERVRTKSNRTVFVGEKDGIMVRMNTDIPFCRGAKLIRRQEPRTILQYECPIEEEEASS